MHWSMVFEYNSLCDAIEEIMIYSYIILIEIWTVIFMHQLRNFIDRWNNFQINASFPT